MSSLFRFPNAVRRDPAVEEWFRTNSGELGMLARHWFEILRQCGEDVRELMHDGYPTACVGDAAFAYVGTFKAHVNVGFFRGAELSDPKHLLQGSGKLMRHVKLLPDKDIDEAALRKLIAIAYRDMRKRVDSE